VDGKDFVRAWGGWLDFAIEADELVEHAIFAESGADELASGGGDAASGIAIAEEFDDAICELAAVGGRDDQSVFAILDHTEHSADA
jgi:hypothetical protein